MAEIISEKRALEIAGKFAVETAQAHPVAAVIAIGSLGGGYYRPGQSDIDTAIILDCPREEAARHEQDIEKLAAEYCRVYSVPKDFGAVVMSRAQLFPPYAPEEELVLEIMRIKLQGRVIYGTLDADAVPMPGMDSVRGCENAFEDWRDGEAPVPPGRMTRQMTVNSILILLRRYLMLECGVVEFNKRRMIPLYLANRPPMISERFFSAIEAYLAEGDAAIDNALLLEMSKWHEDLLDFMNMRLLGRRKGD